MTCIILISVKRRTPLVGNVNMLWKLMLILSSDNDNYLFNVCKTSQHNNLKYQRWARHLVEMEDVGGRISNSVGKNIL